MELNWYQDYALSREALPSGTSPVLEHLWPMTADYFSGLHPVFLERVGDDLSFLKTKKHWLVRDGVLPALRFFLTQNPAEFSGTLYVHRELDPLIPEAWRKKTRLYQVESLPPSSELSSLLITGVLSSVNMDPEDLRVELASLVAAIPRGMKVFAYLPVRSASAGLDDRQAGEGMQEILRALKGKLEFVDYRFIKYRSGFRGLLLHELNPRWIYADSFLLHSVLGRGGSLLKAPSRLRGEAIPLSPFHVVRISDPGKKTAFTLEPRELEAAMSLTRFGTAPVTREPWPEGFIRLVKRQWRNFR